MFPILRKIYLNLAEYGNLLQSLGDMFGMFVFFDARLSCLSSLIHCSCCLSKSYFPHFRGEAHLFLQSQSS